MVDTVAHLIFYRYRHCILFPVFTQHQNKTFQPSPSLLLPISITFTQDYFASLRIQKRVLIRFRIELSPTISILTTPSSPTMAEETNMALSNPATSGAETENSQQDNGAKATDIAMDEGTSELPKEGAEQEEATESMSDCERPHSDARLIHSFLSATKTNGDTNHATDNKPSTSALDTQDTEMPDTAETDEVRGAESSPAVPPINGTPAPSKRANTGGSSRKKSSAVPEHKSKKLNKKKSRPLTNLNAQPGEYYIARMKGHPPWPSVICDEDMLPQSLLTTRPVTAALEDGTFKRTDYADGGKRAHERTFPIMFL